jgi:hypothetical protein
MLSEFLHSNRSELIERCQAKAATRNRSEPVYNADGIPQFISQLIAEFRAEEAHRSLADRKPAAPGRPSLALVPAGIPTSAAKHGTELRRQGLTIDQVVHDYGDLCQALTELAMEKDATISVDEFHTFNRCLDEAIAGAVTSYSRNQTHPVSHWSAMGEKPESVEQQIRVLLRSATVSFAAIRAGQVAINGTTASLHSSNLVDLKMLLDEVLADGEPGSGKDGTS